MSTEPFSGRRKERGKIMTGTIVAWVAFTVVITAIGTLSLSAFERWNFRRVMKKYEQLMKEVEDEPEEQTTIGQNP
jgi:hypothetical protein